ncbi:Uncharacterised protein (plasmid) [Mesomycoplasma conjunctivae]|uniref:Ribbon-helix-helix protein CopG domain-containing protein n=1 Tax=Mesomycoplasma conjunctivae (strain ATCC 25834 / NCTC 10147 / HRC/581) TaxID=572263 RepID=C5J6G7_MESCH|nr:hypothetical protein [Mesomycoplasma conjunctivae]CAT05059.1 HYPOTHETICAL PROTEIN MCJ_003700 [Mesomycoplasma conjunctivae]VEU66284.1 Uncharacterised protein [Mesomycoplasma conjunctivae]VEU66794.1 Uncharacterised protein [Mesomycoplasma conjunctivae]
MGKQENSINLIDFLNTNKEESQESKDTRKYQLKESNKEESFLDSILSKKMLQKKTIGFFIPIEYERKLIKIAKAQNLNKSQLLTLILEKILKDY